MSMAQELLGIPNQQLYFDLRGPSPLQRTRHWFVDEKGSRLLQVQDDCVVHNWRKTSGDPEYPRYEQIRQEFAKELRSLATFVQREGLGELKARQCELTYVNEIELEGRDVADVLAGWTGATSDECLPAPETVEVGSSYVMHHEGRPSGRLHVHAQTLRTAAASRVLRLTLTARGAPAGQTIDAALGWLDVGRGWVVRGFASVTRLDIQTGAWQRTR